MFDWIIWFCCDKWWLWWWNWAAAAAAAAAAWWKSYGEGDGDDWLAELVLFTWLLVYGGGKYGGAWNSIVVFVLFGDADREEDEDEDELVK